MKAYFGQKYYFKLNVDCQFTLVALCSELFNKPNKNVTVVSLKKCVRTTCSVGCKLQRTVCVILSQLSESAYDLKYI